MLESLHVQNLALIEEAQLDFTEGLNILSGETGAGKSVLIGSVNLAIGERADADMIRRGCDSALIELVFYDTTLPVSQKLEQLDLPSEDGTIIISRRITPNRSVFKINGETVTAKVVKSLAEPLLDMHGQHEHQSLLKKTKHREILDTFAGEELELLFPQIKELLKQLKEEKELLASLSMDEESRRRELSLAEFECREIQQASLKEGEDEELEEQFRTMSHARKIRETGADILHLLDGSGNADAVTLLGQALRKAGTLSGLDKRLDELFSALSDAESMVRDFHRDMEGYLEDLAFQTEQFDEIAARLDLINHLKSKYGRTVTDILEYGEKQQKRAEELENADAAREESERRIEKLTEKYEKVCKEASELRKKAARSLEEKLTEALLDLNFLQVRFSVSIDSGMEYASPLGYDSVEFLVSLNPGEEVRPLVNVASGGELSRIMLGIKTVLADADQVPTLIFDEIDSGISGRTAWKVAEKLNTLSRSRQVLCITHLPQIAAMADTHFCIDKEALDGSSVTTISKLDEDQRVREVARMSGGDVITEAGLSQARELIAQKISG